MGPFSPLETAMAVFLTAVCLSLTLGYALPVDPRKQVPGGEDGKNVPLPANVHGNPNRPGIPEVPGLDKEEYNRYWREMVLANPALQEHLKKMNPEDLAKLHPRVSERMARDSDEIRNRLEEARRMNVEEMRDLHRLQMMQDNERKLSPDSEWVARQQALRDKLPDNFDQRHIQKRLEEQRQVLEEIDHKRRANFEHYEMQMEHKRKEKLKAMSEQERLRAEEKLRQEKEQQMHHERLNQPASKQQLEEVWENEDGLKDEQFDPKTFFFLHDTDGDRNLDPMELEALFYNEAKKVYGKNSDGIESHEEMARMREFAMKQLDHNHDGIVALEEFLGYTRGDKFDENKEWKPVVDKEEQAFTEEELENYDDYYDYYDYEYDEHGNIIGVKTKPSEQHPSPPSLSPPAEGMNGDTGDPGAVQYPSDSDATDKQSAPTATTDEQQPQIDMSEQEQAQLNVQPAAVEKEGQPQFQKQHEDVKHVPDDAPGQQL